MQTKKVIINNLLFFQFMKGSWFTQVPLAGRLPGKKCMHFLARHTFNSQYKYICTLNVTTSLSHKVLTIKKLIVPCGHLGHFVHWLSGLVFFGLLLPQFDLGKLLLQSLKLGCSKVAIDNAGTVIRIILFMFQNQTHA